MVIGSSVAIVLVMTIGSIYIYQMNKRGGFESVPDNTPLSSLRITKKSNALHYAGNVFSFAVLGDMRWTSEPRIAILKDAEKHNPLFMANLGDVVEFGKKQE